MDPTLATAILASLTSVALGLFAHRTADRARQTSEKTSENALVLDGWKDLVNPLRERNHELEAENAALRAQVAKLTKEKR